MGVGGRGGRGGSAVSIRGRGGWKIRSVGMGRGAIGGFVDLARLGGRVPEEFDVVMEVMTGGEEDVKDEMEIVGEAEWEDEAGGVRLAGRGWVRVRGVESVRGGGFAAGGWIKGEGGVGGWVVGEWTERGGWRVGVEWGLEKGCVIAEIDGVIVRGEMDGGTGWRFVGIVVEEARVGVVVNGDVVKWEEKEGEDEGDGGEIRVGMDVVGVVRKVVVVKGAVVLF